MEKITDWSSQARYLDALRALPNCPKRYHIVTLGCQMNVRDSETYAGMLENAGMTRADALEEADLVLYNTCCVRENAENRALGNVIWLKELKAVKADLVICVAGCMMQEPGMGERVRKMYPFIDVALGTHNQSRFPELLYRAVSSRAREIEVLDAPDGLYECLPTARASAFQHFVTVMYGCNNFCTYCIVPYVRGRERSRDPEDILGEVRRLVDSGAKEITLLGQNVNSYGGGGDRFAELLRRVDETGVERIRFMTSHPKDMSDELIACFGSLKHLCPQLHLPVQSGSDRVLDAMNRRYTRERYLELVRKIRKVCPDIGLSTDVIVGFPGETYDEFSETVSLMREARYDAAFTFIYSPRPGTKAAEMPDDTPYEEKSRRLQLLIDAQQRNTSEICQAQAGKTLPVLVEGASARDEAFVGGKTARGHMVNFPGNADLIGKIVNVKITSAGKNTLRGERTEENP